MSTRPNADRHLHGRRSSLEGEGPRPSPLLPPRSCHHPRHRCGVILMPDTHLPATVAAPQGGGTRIPAEIAQAIGQVMTGIKSLPKSEHNGHAGYNFASIDAFLSAVGPLCSAAGLIVLQ